MKVRPGSEILTCFGASKAYIAVTYHRNTCLYTLHKEKEEEEASEISRFLARIIHPGIKHFECSSNPEDYVTLIVLMVTFKYQLGLISRVYFSVMHSKVSNYFYCFFPALSKMVKDAVVLQLWEKDRD